ncbi:MAG TPA: hypothetical protein VGN13_00305 [Solirubrobacteraceae bacterium]
MQDPLEGRQVTCQRALHLPVGRQLGQEDRIEPEMAVRQGDDALEAQSRLIRLEQAGPGACLPWSISLRAAAGWGGRESGRDWLRAATRTL